MKKLPIVLFFMVAAFSVSSQDLIDIYKTGKVKLVPDKGYASDNNWEKVFETYYDTLYHKPMGNRKSIVLLPDGSVVVNHTYRNYYSLFNPEGGFVKEFGLIKGQGWRFKDTQAIRGIIEHIFFTKPNNNGKMLCFDFEGNYVKTLTLDYMTKGIVALPNNKIAVVGWAIWKTKFRDFVSIVDYETNEETVIWEYFTDRNLDRKGGSSDLLFNYSYFFEKQGGVSCTTMPFSGRHGIKARPELACINDQLIVANPNNGELQIFDLNGKLMSKKQMNLMSNQISIEEQKEIQHKAIEKYKGMDPLRFKGFVGKVGAEESQKAHNYFIKAMEEDLDKITEPIQFPVFSTMIKDSDGNLLFFEFPEEEGANKFNVWIFRDGGSFICQSSFVCDDYNLEIKPSKLVFHDGYLYGLQTLKETSGNPLRLVRFKITSN